MTKIIYRTGDMFAGPEYFLAHGCNNRGVMGSGVAKIVKERFEKAYDFYRWNHTRQGLMMGQIYGIDCEDADRPTGHSRYIINCITQNGYGYDGKQYVDYDAIRDCVLCMNGMKGEGPMDIGMPMIGAGLGGGDWETIANIIEEHTTFQPVVYKL